MVQGVEIKDNQIINRNPATGETINKIPCTKLQDIESIIKRSQHAQQNVWSILPLQERLSILKKALEESLSPKKEELAITITKEMGKVKSESLEEVSLALDQDELFKLLQEANEDEIINDSCTIVRDAHGVVVVLSPWNFPVLEILLLVLPALAAGNTVIVKPSEVTPTCGEMIVTGLASLLPKDVIQLTQGDGTVGAALVQADGVNMVAMTGSSDTGRKIVSSCSSTLKRVILELGGKDPMIVFSDADMSKAVSDAVTYSLYNTGQVCCAVERIYVEESIKDEFEEKVVQLAKEYTVGNGLNDASKVGPMVSKMQFDIVNNHINKTISEGGKLLYQSNIPKKQDNDDNNVYYCPVTVITDLNQQMTIQRNETFGPIIAISSFSGEENDAVNLANDTEYGLTSYVYTSDKDKAKRVALKIKSGQVGINCYSPEYASTKCPWVGHKGSGYGYHSGLDGLRQFSLPKSLVWYNEDDDSSSSEE